MGRKRRCGFPQKPMKYNAKPVAVFSANSNNTIIVNMPYDKAAVDIFRKIPGRIYDYRLKIWSFPLSFYDTLVQLLEPIVTVIGLSTEVLKALKSTSSSLLTPEVDNMSQKICNQVKQKDDDMLSFQDLNGHGDHAASNFYSKDDSDDEALANLNFDDVTYNMALTNFYTDASLDNLNLENFHFDDDTDKALAIFQMQSLEFEHQLEKKKRKTF